jgi:hypothetical protein
MIWFHIFFSSFLSFPFRTDEEENDENEDKADKKEKKAKKRKKEDASPNESERDVSPHVILDQDVDMEIELEKDTLPPYLPAIQGECPILSVSTLRSIQPTFVTAKVSSAFFYFIFLFFLREVW